VPLVPVGQLLALWPQCVQFREGYVSAAWDGNCSIALGFIIIKKNETDDTDDAATTEGSCERLLLMLSSWLAVSRVLASCCLRGRGLDTGLGGWRTSCRVICCPVFSASRIRLSCGRCPSVVGDWMPWTALICAASRVLCCLLLRLVVSQAGHVPHLPCAVVDRMSSCGVRFHHLRFLPGVCRIASPALSLLRGAVDWMLHLQVDLDSLTM